MGDTPWPMGEGQVCGALGWRVRHCAAGDSIFLKMAARGAGIVLTGVAILGSFLLCVLVVGALVGALFAGSFGAQKEEKRQAPRRRWTGLYPACFTAVLRSRTRDTTAAHPRHAPHHHHGNSSPSSGLELAKPALSAAQCGKGCRDGAGMACRPISDHNLRLSSSDEPCQWPHVALGKLPSIVSVACGRMPAGVGGEPAQWTGVRGYLQAAGGYVSRCTFFAGGDGLGEATEGAGRRTWRRDRVAEARLRVAWRW